MTMQNDGIALAYHRCNKNGRCVGDIDLAEHINRSGFDVLRTFRRPHTEAMVESGMGAVAWGHWPAPRFPSPLIEPDVRSYQSGSPTGFTARPTAGQSGAGVLGTARRGSDEPHRT